jgi:mannitol 2-dehydrogenase
MATQLSNDSLATLGKTVAVPHYDRHKLTAGILHFGVGNFHRAHQAVYLDDLFNLGRDLDFGIVGAGVMASDRTMRQQLIQQDFLTTVV